MKYIQKEIKVTQTKETNFYPVINSSKYMSFSSMEYKVLESLEGGKLIKGKLIQINRVQGSPKELIEIPEFFYIDTVNGKILSEDMVVIADTSMIR